MAEEIKQWDYRVHTFGSTWSNAKAEDVEAALIEWGVKAGKLSARFTNQPTRRLIIAKRPLTHAVICARSMPSYKSGEIHLHNKQVRLAYFLHPAGSRHLWRDCHLSLFSRIAGRATRSN